MHLFTFLVYVFITYTYFIIHLHIDGLVQEKCNAIAKPLELHLSCTNPSIYWRQSHFTEAVEMIVNLSLDNNLWSVLWHQMIWWLSAFHKWDLLFWWDEFFTLKWAPETLSSMVRCGVWVPYISLPLVANTSSGLILGLRPANERCLSLAGRKPRISPDVSPVQPQSGATIMQFNITWYTTQHCKNWGKT